MREVLSIVVVAAALLLVACDLGGKPEPTGRAGPIPLADVSSVGAEVYPLSNGDAYLLTPADGQLFYLSRGAAVRVKGVTVAGFQETIYPTATGAAYLVSTDGAALRLYYLQADSAVHVKEVASVQPAQSLNIMREGFLWAQVQAETTRSRRVIAAVEDEQPDRDRETREP